MRKQVLALIASVPLLLSFAASDVRARDDDDYGPPWRGHYGGYGYGRGHGDDDYGPRWGRDRGWYGPRWRSEQRGYGPGGRERWGHSGMMEHGMMGPGMMGPGMMGPGMMGPGMMRMIIALMDTDNDGAVSLAEFQAAHERIFRALDANKDGRLTVDELQSLFRGARDTPKQDSSAPSTPGKPAQ